jgi:hypothetical protein
VFARAGISKLDPKKVAVEPVGKEVRVRVTLGSVGQSAQITEALVQDLLARMRVRGCFDAETEDQYAGEATLRAAVGAFEAAGWVMDTSGHIAPAVLPDFSEPGIRPARLARARHPLRVDVNVGDRVSPPAVAVEYPSLLGEPFSVVGYPLETVLAEKIVTTIDRGDTTTRERDFADVHLLMGSRPVDADALARAIAATASHPAPS